MHLDQRIRQALRPSPLDTTEPILSTTYERLQLTPGPNEP